MVRFRHLAGPSVKFRGSRHTYIATRALQLMTQKYAYLVTFHIVVSTTMQRTMHEPLADVVTPSFLRPAWSKWDKLTLPRVFFRMTPWCHRITGPTDSTLLPKANSNVSNISHYTQQWIWCWILLMSFVTTQSMISKSLAPRCVLTYIVRILTSINPSLTFYLVRPLNISTYFNLPVAVH